ncbi:MAG: ATP-binding cassette domain-containing protein [Bacteroidales bacterium]|nr:ATP-binding cassette domain-containing protein [Bacteroidales bacterium]
MTKKLFDALVRLFAIAVNRDTDADNQNVKRHFESFLNDYLDPKFINSFILLFDNYLNEFSSEISGKKLALNSVKLIKYCEETAKDLSEEEKAVLVFNLVRLISETSDFKKSLEFIRLISDIYNIDITYTDNLIAFFGDGKCSHVCKLELVENKFIDYLYFSNGIYAIKNLTDLDLSIDTVGFAPQKICFALKTSVINYKHQLKYFFHDLINRLDDKKEGSFSIYFKDVEVVKGKKTILHKTNLSFKSGEFVGVIGKSGAGKTTLLDVLSNCKSDNGGEVIVYKDDPEANNPVFCYLKQSFSFIPFFTVREHLQQRLEFLQIKKHKWEQFINKVSSAVDLKDDLDKIAVKNRDDSGQLSGGQQKRLRIAMELLANPDVFILDEPTSGLASNDSYNILSILKTVSQTEKLIVASVHQPDFDSLNLFDKIIILDEGGFIVYSGSPLSAAEYLRSKTNSVDKLSLLEETRNPSVLLELVDRGKSGNQNDFWYKEYNKIDFVVPEKLTVSTEISRNKSSKLNLFYSIFSQLKLSLKIDFKNHARLALLLVIPLIAGLLFAYISRFSNQLEYSYYLNPNIPVWVLMTIITAVFTGLISSSNEFIALRDFHNAENYFINKDFSLSLSKIIKYIVFSAVQAFLLVFPAIILLKINFIFGEIFVIIWLLNSWGAITGLLLSRLTKSSSVVYLIIPLIIVVNMLFSGVMIKFDEFNSTNTKNAVPKLSLFVPAYHGVNALMTEMYLSSDKHNETIEEKIMLYESAYYLDYFLPAVNDIYINDSLRAITLIQAETGKNLLMPEITDLNFKESIATLRIYYENQNNVVLDKMSAKYDYAKNQSKFKNGSIDKIVENYYSSTFVVLDSEIQRRFMPAYIPPYYNQKGEVFFSPYKNIIAQKFDNYTVGVILIIILSLIMSVFVIIIRKPYV